MAGIPGIDFFLWDSYQNNYVNQIVTALITITTIGFLLDLSIDLAGYFVSLFVAKQKQQD